MPVNNFRAKLTLPAHAPHLRPCRRSREDAKAQRENGKLQERRPRREWLYRLRRTVRHKNHVRAKTRCHGVAHMQFCRGTNGAPRASVKLPHPALAPHLRPAGDCSMRYSTSCIDPQGRGKCSRIAWSNPCHAVVGSTLRMVGWLMGMIMVAMVSAERVALGFAKLTPTNGLVLC
jgi:hypothetical protein